MVEKMTVVKRIDVFSLGKVVGLIYAIFGVIIGAIITIFSLLGAVAMQGLGFSGAMSLFFGIGSVIVIPIFYGIMGFIVGALAAWFYNIIAGWVGGIEIEVDVT
ncbi:MAG: hypothetical protein SCH66_01980 [Methanolobus sp.]|nr:hypothetical protein [Methanolobus sp.]